MQPTPSVNDRPGVRTVRTARSVVWLAGGEVIGKLGTLVIMVAAARLLGAADFGAFSFALSLGLVLAVLVSWGFDLEVIRRGSQDAAVVPRLLAETLLVRAVVGLALWGVTTACFASAAPAMTVTASLVVLSCLVDTLTGAFRAVLAVLDAQHWSSVAVVAQRTGTAGLGVAALLLHGGTVGLAVITLAGSVLALWLLMRATRRLGVRPAWRSVRTPGIRGLFVGSWGAGLHNTASMALFRVDQVLLGLLAGATAVGFYAAGYRLLETVLFVAWAIAQAIFPVMAAAPDGDRLRQAFGRSFTVVTAVFLPYAVVLLLRGPDLLGLLYGASYAQGGAAIVRWLAPAPLLFAAAYLLTYVLMAARPARYVAVAGLAVLGLNVVLNLVLAPWLGGTGAAIATTASYLVEAVVLAGMVGAVVPLRGWAPGWARSLAPAVAGSALLGAVLLAGWSLLPTLLVGAAGYLGVWYLVAQRTDPEQVQVLNAIIRKGN